MSGNGNHWYQQPIAWLGIVIFVASLAGCVHLIVLAATHEDPPIPTADKDISFRIPATRDPPEAPTPVKKEP